MQFHHTDDAPPAIGPYSQAVEIDGWLYLSGQVDYDAAGNCAHPGDFAAQAKGVLDAIKAQIEAGGGTMANIVKVNTYVTDLRHRPIWAEVRAQFFGPKMPASTMVWVTALAHPDFLIEVEAVAVF